MTDKEYLEHRCDRLPPEGVLVVSADQYLDGDDWPWCLMVQREATDRDLEEHHYLETVGETIWYTVVGIAHCPYCGTRLPGDDAAPAVRDAEYRHVDSGGWKSAIS